MYTVTYTEYVNDYNQREMVKSFYNLNAISDWLYNHAINDTYVFFTNPKQHSDHPVISATGWKTNIYIHQIDSGNGIEFSDGRHTNKLAHISSAVAQWLIEKRTQKRTFNFAK